MGEKPLSIDEAPGQTTSVGAAGPLGGVDAPPPGIAAAGINTTRSNIKHSGGIRSEPTRTGDPFPQDTGPGQPGGSAGGIQAPQADEGGIAIKEQGVKHGEDGAAPEADAPGVAAGAPPIPGVDIIVKKNPPR